MTLYDALMAGVVVAGMVWGAWRGITWQLASIASLVLGYSVAHPLSGQLAPRFPGEPAVARALAMLVIYAAVSCSIFLVAWIIRAALRRLKFEAFDRHLGMILGGLEGALVGLVVTLFVVSLVPQARDPIFASPTGRLVGQTMDTLGPVLPGEVRSVLAPFWTSPAATTSGAEQEQASGPKPWVRQDDVRGPGRDRPGAGPQDPVTLQELIDAGRSRISRTIAEAVEQEVQRRGGMNDRAVERR